MSGAPKAGWWQRAGAAIIDALIVVAGAIVVAIVVALAGTGTDGVTVAVYAAVIVATFTYGPLLMAREGRANGQTVGKAALGIRVVHDDGHPMTVGRGLLREGVGKGLLGLVPLYSFIDILWPLVDQRRQALHDKVGTTYVVDAAQVSVVTGHELDGFAPPDPHASWSAASQPAGAPPPPPASAWAPPAAGTGRPQAPPWSAPADRGAGADSEDGDPSTDDDVWTPPADDGSPADTRAPADTPAPPAPPPPPPPDLGGFAPPLPPPSTTTDDDDRPSGPFGPSYD